MPTPKKSSTVSSKRAPLAPAKKSPGSAKADSKKSIPEKGVVKPSKASAASQTRGKEPAKKSPKPAEKKGKATISPNQEVKRTVIENNTAVQSDDFQSAVLANASVKLHLKLPVYDEGAYDEGADPGHMPTDEVMDEGDQAQHLQLQELAAINRRARDLNKPEVHEDFDGEHCVECDTKIPQARLLLRKVRCVDCQTFLEEDGRRRQRTLA